MHLAAVFVTFNLLKNIARFLVDVEIKVLKKEKIQGNINDISFKSPVRFYAAIGGIILVMEFAQVIFEF